MNLTLEQAVGQQMLVAFTGREPSVEILARLRRQHLGGVSLFRSMNVDTPAQVRRLTAALQAAAREAGQPPLLLATDQEGGTLQALAGLTPFPGNMALGATDSPDLVPQAGLAIGREMAAVALRLPYDIMTYPSAETVVCTYSLQPPSLEALAGALWGHLPFTGRLPVPLPGF